MAAYTMFVRMGTQPKFGCLKKYADRRFKNTLTRNEVKREDFCRAISKSYFTENSQNKRHNFKNSYRKEVTISSTNSYPDTYIYEYVNSITDPEAYWGEISKNTIWFKPWDKVIDNSNPPFTNWFVGGKTNMCYNAVDRHIQEGNGDRNAIIWDSPITNSKEIWTYMQVQEKAAKLARVLTNLNVKTGDVVLIYMSMIPEALVAMLACTRIGAIHSVVFGGFSSKELGSRIRHCEPKVILTTTCGLEPNRTIEYIPIVNDALKIANAPNIPTIVYKRNNFVQTYHEENFLDWDECVSKNSPHDCVEVDSNHPLYILYTSGTTGEPKSIQHPTGSHAVVNKWTMKNLYGLSPGECWWAASDIGWVVGHEYICYSPLLNGNTTVMYEGKPVGTPDAGQFFRVISEHNVAGCFLTPTAVRAIKAVDINAAEGKKYDISCLKYMFIAGEPCDLNTRNWAEEHFNVPVLNNWWQTETAHAITATCVGLGNRLDPPKTSAGKPVPGFDVRVIKEDGNEAGIGQLGRIVCKLPIAPGTMTTLFKADQRFKDTYFSNYIGFYDTMDAGYVDKDGYLFVVARDDDVINVAGHRFSTSALEEVLLGHKDVAEAAVVGVPDQLKGQAPLGLYVLKKDSERGDQIEQINKEIIAKVRTDIGPVCAFRQVTCVNGLPKTRSGKTARKTISDLAAGKTVKIPPTIEDTSVYVNIRQELERLGYRTQNIAN